MRGTPHDQPASRGPDPRAALRAPLRPRADRQPAARGQRWSPTACATCWPGSLPRRRSAPRPVSPGDTAIRHGRRREPRRRRRCRRNSGNCCCSPRSRRWRSRGGADRRPRPRATPRRSSPRRASGLRSAARDRRAHHRGRADHRHGHRGAGRRAAATAWSASPRARPRRWRWPRRTRPGLILADINLGVGGDGTSAVARIMQQPPRAGDLRHRLSRAAADRRGGRAGLRDHQAVRAD